MAAATVAPVHETSPGSPDVRGFLHRPTAASRGGVVLTHGAGSDCNAPLLAALARALSARGLGVLRCDLPYRQLRRHGPPRPGQSALDRAGLERAAAVLRAAGGGPVFLGGQSYGGRQASMLAADEPALARALLLLSYPLHPPGKPAQLRTAHFAELRTPAVFVHGSEDPFGSLAELDSARALIGARTALIAVDGAGHGLIGRGRSRGPAPEVVERIADGFTEFIEEVVHGN